MAAFIEDSQLFRAAFRCSSFPVHTFILRTSTNVRRVEERAMAQNSTMNAVYGFPFLRFPNSLAARSRSPTETHEPIEYLRQGKC